MNSFVMGYPESFIEYFKQFPVTLTSLRKAVLFSLWEAKRPLKDYDILDYLNRIKPTMTAATVYRALDFFMNVGLIHKIESMQAYTLCSAPQSNYSLEILMVCDHCYKVTEVYEPSLRESLIQITNHASFQVSQDVIELKGLCLDCR